MNAAFSFVHLAPLQLPSQSALDLVANAGIVVKVVLAVLMVFSIVSWAIILEKWRVFRRVRKESNEFLHFFRKRKNLREILHLSRRYPANPFVVVFKEAYWLLSQSENTRSGGQVGGTVDMLREGRAAPTYSNEDLLRIFDATASQQVMSLEKYLIFLATTGSVSPFFGLFGTVWGVMSAFLAIAFTGSADLSVVAPGIAEALITTVAGLGAAIPAVIAYNYFVNRLQRLSGELEVFYAELIQMLNTREAHEVS